ncbi:MAG: response regulator transcription factor [Planctomycetaceae bacterium]
MTGQRILVTDDSGAIRVQVARILTDAGFDVETARDGAEAVSMVQNDVPMLMVLDVNMPALDGFGVCLELRRMGPPWCDVPIVFLTSSNTQALSILGNEMGAYLKKPVCEDELLQTVRSFLPCATGA